MKILIRKKTLCEYFIALAVILDCNSVWNNLDWSRSWFQYLLLTMLGLAVVGYIISNNRLPRNALVFCIVIPIYFIFYYLINGNSILKTTVNIMLVSLLLCLYFVSKSYDDTAESLLIAFKNIMLCIAVISLFFWITGSVLEILQPTGQHLTNWTGNNNQTVIKSYYGVYYSYQNISFFDKLYIVRNIAIFNEAPMSSVCFSMGLMIELLCCEHFKKRNCIVFIIAILSTFSTTGYIIATVVCVYKYIRSKSQYSILKCLKILLIPVLFCVALIVAITLVQEKLSTYSGIARSDDFISGARAWLLHPVFGDGIGSLDAMSLVRPSWRKSAEGFNSGLMQLLVQGGIYLTLPYIVILMNGIRKSVKSRNYDRFIFVGLFCLIFAITVISFNYLTLMILLFLLRK